MLLPILTWQNKQWPWLLITHILEVYIHSKPNIRKCFFQHLLFEINTASLVALQVIDNIFNDSINYETVQNIS